MFVQEEHHLEVELETGMNDDTLITLLRKPIFRPDRHYKASTAEMT